MKKIYKVLYPIGYEVHEVPAGFPTAIPFVEIAPKFFERTEAETDDEFERKQQSQFFNFEKNEWQEAVTQDYSKRLSLLENLFDGVDATNEKLDIKTKNLDSQLTETQMAVAEIFEMVVSGGDLQ